MTLDLNYIFPFVYLKNNPRNNENPATGAHHFIFSASYQPADSKQFQLAANFTGIVTALQYPSFE